MTRKRAIKYLMGVAHFDRNTIQKAFADTHKKVPGSSNVQIAAILLENWEDAAIAAHNINFRAAVIVKRFNLEIYHKKRVRLSDIIGPAFYETHKLIDMGVIDEAVESGGRASLKSSYVGTEVVLQLVKHPDCHALVTRQVGDTMRDSVYAQILWAIDKLGLTTKFKCTQSPLQCTYTPTGQRILFRGLDDPQKIKSIKLPFGYIGILWFEEADQIKGGEDAVRNVQQSALRGGEFGLTFISFNPPAASRNWANRYAREERKGKRIHHSTYLQAPAAWLGPKFLAQAEYIKETQPTKYRHEYLGEVVGSGTQVFENLRLEPISQKTIRNFDTIENGVDWGWYPDPWAFNRCHYDAARKTLYMALQHASILPSPIFRGWKLDWVRAALPSAC